MANEIKETSIRRIQTQLNQLTTLLPNLQDERHPAGQLWSEILQELHQLTKDLDRQEELIDQRIEQVITLHNISSRLGSHLDLTTLLNDLAEFSAKLMGAEISVVKLADERRQSFTIRASYSMLGSSTISTDQSEELTTNINFQVIQAKEAVLANDWPNHPLAAATETSLNVKVSAASSANKILAILSVPIILQGEVTGIIEVQSFTNNHAFDENDLHILSLLADHAATAIKNTQLYNRAENSYRFLKTVIEHIPDPIFIKDNNHTLIEMNQANAAIIGHREAELIGKTDFDLFPSELADKFRQRDDEVFSGNQLVVAEDKTVWADGQEHIGYTRLVPIPDPSGQPEYLLGITQDVTERKAREAEREQLLAETTALYNGSQSITRALSERQIFDALFDQIRQHDPCEISAFRFHLVEDEPVWTELVANWQKRNNPTYPEKTRFYLPEYPQARLLATNKPIFIDDIAADERLSAEERTSFAPTAACSVAFLPLGAAGQKFGAVLVYFTRPYSFTETVQRLWIALLDQVSVGLINQQFIQKSAYRAVQMDTAAEVARVASSILDLQELLDTTVALIRDRFDLYYVGVFLLDKAKEWAVLRAGTGEAGRIQLEKGHRLKIGAESMIGWSVQNRQARIALDVGKDAVHFQNPDLPETRSEMALPLIHRTEVIGALTIQSIEQAAFRREDIVFLQTMADQLAVAVENARLFTAARQSEAKYRELVENANSIIFRMNTKGEVTFFNEFAQRFFGYAEAEIIGRNVVGTIVPETDTSGQNLTTMINNIIKHPERYASNENENIRRNGERVWVAWTNKAILDDRHRFTEILCVGNDITEHKQAEQLLRNSEALYSSLVESLPQYIFRKDLDGRFTFANQRYLDQLGRSLEELVGKTDVDLYPKEWAEKYQQDDRQVIENQQILDLVEEQQTAAGDVRYVRVVKTPSYDANGDTIGIQGISWDVTERKRAEEELLKFKLGIERATDAIFLTDTDGTIIYVNPAFEKIYGYTSEEAIGKTPRILKSGELPPEVYQQFWSTILAKETVAGELINKAKDGRLLHIEGSASPVLDEAGNIIAFLAIQHDITDRKQVQEALAQREQYMEALVEIQTQLLAYYRIEDYYPKILEVLGRVSGASRIYIFENHQDATGSLLMSRHSEWCAPGIQPQIDNPELQNLAYEESFPRWADTLGRGEIIAGAVANFPESERAILEPQDLLAILVLPLIVNGEFFGFIGFDNCVTPRPWEQSDADLLQIAAAAVARWHERRLAREALSQERNLLRTLIDNLPDYVFVKDTESRFVLNNAAHLRVLGAASPEDVVGKTDFDIFPEELASQYFADEQKIIESGQPLFNREEATASPENETQWLLTTKVPLRDSQGEVTGLVGVSHDITERKLAEEALEESQHRLRTILEAVQAGIIIVDIETREVIDANPAALQMIGAEREAVVGTVCHQHICPAEQGKCPICDLGQTVDNSERVLLTAQGKLVPIIKNVVPVTLGNRKLLIESFVNIAEQKQAEESLQETLRRSQLLYNISEALTTMTYQQAALETILGEYLLLLNLGQGSINLFDRATGNNRVQAQYFDNKVTKPKFALDATEDLIAQYLSENPFPLVIEDVQTHPLTTNNPQVLSTMSGMLLIPLIARGEVVGTLSAEATEKEHIFSQEDIEAGKVIADQLAIWLENRQLMDETEHRSNLLATGAKVSGAASSMLDLDELISTSVNLIRDQFDFYYVGLFLVDNARRWTVLRAGTGEAGRIQVEKGHRLEIGGESMIGWSVANRQARIALDVGEDAVHFQNPYLPDTRSEMALPLNSRDEVIGALTVQSVEQNAFSNDDITVLQTMADQLANAIANARLFDNVMRSQKAAETLLQETQALQQFSQALAGTLQTGEIFDLFFQACTQEIGFEYVVLSMVEKHKAEVNAVAGVGISQGQLKRSRRPLDSSDIMADIVRTGKTEVITGWDDRFDREMFKSEGHAEWIRLFSPIVLRRENVGLVEAGFNITKRATIEDSQIRLLRAFIDQTALALDNAQRYQASKMAARREALIKEITTKVRASTDLDNVLRTTVKEVGDAIGGKRAYVHLISPTNGETKTRE